MRSPAYYLSLLLCVCFLGACNNQAHPNQQTDENLDGAAIHDDIEKKHQPDVAPDSGHTPGAIEGPDVSVPLPDQPPPGDEVKSPDDEVKSPDDSLPADQPPADDPPPSNPPPQPKPPTLPNIPVGGLPKPGINISNKIPGLNDERIPGLGIPTGTQGGSVPDSGDPAGGQGRNDGRIKIPAVKDINDILKDHVKIDPVTGIGGLLDGGNLTGEVPEILLQDDFDANVSARFRHYGQMTLEPVEGIKGKGVSVKPGFAASQNLEDRGLLGRMTNGHFQPIANQNIFNAQCRSQEAQAVQGDGLSFAELPYSDKVPLSQRHIRYDFKNLKGHGNLEVIIQIKYYDANDQLIPKVKADGTTKSNFTHDKIRIPLNCQGEPAAIDFDLFSISQTNNLHAVSAQYQMSLRLSPNGSIAYDGMVNAVAASEKHEALYYDLTSLPNESYTTTFFAKPKNDLQKDKAAQTLFELVDIRGGSLMKVGVQNRQLKVTKAGQNIAVAAGLLSLDPLYWDAFSVSVSANQIKLYSRTALLATIDGLAGRPGELCLGSDCSGQNISRYVYDELSIYRGANVNFCWSCADNPSGMTAFKKVDSDFFDVNTMPTQAEQLATISAWSYPGANEKISFGLRSEIPYEDVSFEVTPLTNGRNSIQPDKVSIRLAKYWKQIKNKIKVSSFDEIGLTEQNTDVTPELLLKDDRQNFYGVTRAIRNANGVITSYEYPSPLATLQTSFQAPENKLMWLNVKLSDQQVAGVYTGSFKIKKGRQILKSIPLRFEVLPVALLTPEVKKPDSNEMMEPSFGMYFRDRVDPPTEQHEGVSFTLFEKHVSHMASLGMNTIELRPVEVAAGQDRMAKFVRVLNLIKDYHFKKIVMGCVHPEDRGGYPDYSYYDRAKSMGFDVYCYGMDEPGGVGMSNQLQRTLEIHSRMTRQEKKNHFDVSIPQFWRSMRDIPYFANYVHNLLNENIADKSFRDLMTLLEEKEIDLNDFWNDFYAAARLQPVAVRNQIKNAIPQAWKDLVARAIANERNGSAPKVATANFKEISVFMDGYTIEAQLADAGEAGFIMEDEMVAFLEDQFEKSGYDDKPYLKIAPHYYIPFDFLAIDDLGLDTTILSNAFEGFNRYHRDYIKNQLRHMRGQFPMNPLSGSINQGQEQWYYFGNRDGKKQLIYARYMFGYYLFMTKAHGVMPYVYQHGNIGARGDNFCVERRPEYEFAGSHINCLSHPDYEDPFVDFDGLKASGRKDDNGIEVEDDYLEKDDFYVYPANNDYIETMLSEMVREGIKDYKILSTAEQLLIEKGAPADIQKFKDIIGRFMDATISTDNDRCGGYHFCGATQETLEPYFDTARRELADLIIKLQR